jgi:dTDP-4-amino-4,6-dideoxygalactose transaminase
VNSVRCELGEIIVTPSESLRAVMQAIDHGGVEMALVCERERLVGLVSDGDVRRAILAGASLDASIEPYMRTAFLAVTLEAERTAVLELMRVRSISQVPVVDHEGRVLGLHVLNDLIGVRIPLSVPVLGGNASNYLHECVATNFVSTVGPFVSRFEGEFAEWVGSRFAVACSSGTAALHLALLGLDVGPGDEVWVSDLTFIASANPVRYCGADVILVDSESASWNLDPTLVVGELERRAGVGEQQPAVIIAVHLLGHPARLDPILEAAERYGVPVVEDAAEALGARWVGGNLDDRQVGTAGSVGCFSFNGNKIMTTGGGGMVVTDDERLAALCRHLSTQAKLPGSDYRHDVVGFNYRLTNLSAAVGIAQLEQIDVLLARRRAIASRYDAAFRQVESITIPPDLPWAERSAWLYSVLFVDKKRRERVRYALASAQIESRAIWPPLRQQQPYRNARVLGNGSVGRDVALRALSLPCSTNLTTAEQDQVIDIVLDTAMNL